FGAQITFIYSKEMGRIILPKDGAVAIEVTEVERERG
ncbi:MAG: ribonuclease BN, partial [Bacteroidetes bacterium]